MCVEGDRMDKKELKILSGKRLQELREENNLSQNGLADLLGTFQQSIQRYEKGTIKLPDYIAADIIKLFPNYNFEWLLGFSDIKTKNGLEFESLIDRKKQDFKIAVEFIKQSARRKGYKMFLYSSGLIGPSGHPEDCYIIQKGNRKTHVWISTFIDDVADYLDYKLTKTLERDDYNGK